MMLGVDFFYMPVHRQKRPDILYSSTLRISLDEYHCAYLLTHFGQNLCK